jgi:hypothetical protein
MNCNNRSQPQLDSTGVLTATYLEATFVESAGAIANTLAAFEVLADGRVSFVPLKFLVWVHVGVVVVECDDEADGA